MDTPNGAPLDISTVSWPDIFSRHEMNLRNHGELCAMLKRHVIPESQAAQGLMYIIVKTQELLDELGRLRLEFMNHGIAGRVLSGQNVDKVDELRQKAADTAQRDPGNMHSSNNTPNSAPNTTPNPPVFVFDTKPTTASMPQHPKNTKKRFLDDVSNKNDTKTESLFKSSKKLKKDDAPEPEPTPEIPQHQQTFNRAQSQPVVEFQDITDEVERRLKLREERRRRRYLPPQKKRKRESGGSVPTEECAAPKQKRHRSNGSQVEGEDTTSGLSWGKDKRRTSAETSEIEGRNRSLNRKKTKRSKWGQS